MGRLGISSSISHKDLRIPYSETRETEDSEPRLNKTKPQQNSAQEFQLFCWKNTVLQADHQPLMRVSALGLAREEGGGSRTGEASTWLPGEGNLKRKEGEKGLGMKRGRALNICELTALLKTHTEHNLAY